MKTKIEKMKNMFMGIFCLSLLMTNTLTVFAQTDNKNDIPAETRQKIDELNSQMIAAMQKGDLPALMELYTDDAMMILPGGKTLKGKKEISDYLATMKNISQVKINVADAGASGKIMYQVGKATYLSNKNGVETEETKEFVMVFKRQSDWDYKISVNSSN